tara:strand:- start:83 stop:1204 length:1122 start_codon:yes stop_codon:yes gene_type:complete
MPVDNNQDIMDAQVGDVLTPEQVYRAAGGKPKPQAVDPELQDKQNLYYPMDTSEYAAKVVFSIIETTETGASKLLSDVFNSEKKENAELKKSYKEKIDQLKSESKTEAEFEESAKQVAQEYNTLVQNKNQFKGGASEVNTKATIDNFGREVCLYLPIGLAFRDNVTYENFDLGTAGALMEGGMGMAGAMVEGIGSFVSGLQGGAGSDMAKLAGIQLAGKLSSFGAEAGAAQKISGGVTLNPNSRVLFKQPNIREFAFTFKMIAKSADEANQITEIVKFFRTELYPEDIVSEIGGQQISLGYRFPNKFNLQFKYGENEIPNLAKIKPCYLRDVSTTYNASSMAMHEDGNFMEIDMTLAFQETRALTRADVEGGF